MTTPSAAAIYARPNRLLRLCGYALLYTGAAVILLGATVFAQDDAWSAVVTIALGLLIAAGAFPLLTLRLMISRSGITTRKFIRASRVPISSITDIEILKTSHGLRPRVHYGNAQYFDVPLHRFANASEIANALRAVAEERVPLSEIVKIQLGRAP